VIIDPSFGPDMTSEDVWLEVPDRFAPVLEATR
jgi:hypothetical protein